MFVILSGIFSLNAALAEQALPQVLSDSVPLDIRIVVNISKTLKDNDPLALRKQAVTDLIQALPDGSRAGVWTYGKYVNMLVRLNSVDAHWRTQALAAVPQLIHVADKANLADALEVATFDWQKPDNTIRRQLYLFTDSPATLSTDDAEDQVFRADIIDSLTKRLQQAGAQVHSFALGEYADIALMSQLATATGGQFQQVYTEDDVVNVAALLALESHTPVLGQQPSSAPQLPQQQDIARLIDSDSLTLVVRVMTEDGEMISHNVLQQGDPIVIEPLVDNKTVLIEYELSGQSMAGDLVSIPVEPMIVDNHHLLTALSSSQSSVAGLTTLSSEPIETTVAAPIEDVLPVEATVIETSAVLSPPDEIDLGAALLQELAIAQAATNKFTTEAVTVPLPLMDATAQIAKQDGQSDKQKIAQWANEDVTIDGHLFAHLNANLQPKPKLEWQANKSNPVPQANRQPLVVTSDQGYVASSTQGTETVKSTEDAAVQDTSAADGATRTFSDQWLSIALLIVAFNILVIGLLYFVYKRWSRLNEKERIMIENELS